MWQKGKMFVLFLALPLLVALFSPAAAAEEFTPPEWCPAEEYTHFADSAVYEPENWAAVLRLRADAKAGNPAPEIYRSSSLTADWNRLEALMEHDRGAAFELGLISIQYDYNGGMGWINDKYFRTCTSKKREDPPVDSAASLWYYRTIIYANRRSLPEILSRFFSESGYTLSQFWACELLGTMPGEQQQEILDSFQENGMDTTGLTIHPTPPAPFSFVTTGAQIVPDPPAWCPEEEYLRCNESVAYLPENWARIQRIRDFLAAPNAPTQDWPAAIYQDYRYLTNLNKFGLRWGDRGLRFELGMLFSRAYGLSGHWETEWGWYCNNITNYLSGPQFIEDGENAYAAWLWAGRAAALGDTMSGGTQKAVMRYMVHLLSDAHFSMEKFLNCDLFLGMPEQTKKAMSDLTFVCLDGDIVHPGSYKKEWQNCKVINNRTMAPVRCLAEKLGAEVTWNSAAQTVTMERANVTVVMTLGSTTASVNGAPMVMDVAPVAIDQRTYLPVRYLAEFFGQKVDWNQQSQTAFITEDFSVVGTSNLEAWALPMGAPLNRRNGRDVTIFGGWSRGETKQLSPGTNFAAQDAQGALTDPSWGMSNRDDLIATVLAMTDHGHNDSFQAAAAAANSMTAGQLQALLDQSDETDQYMWRYTIQLSEQWGDRGIMAWDLFRMSNLVQWGYSAGWLTYAEALALLEPAAAKLQANFFSWDEAYENYLGGYCWWARENVLNQDIWQTERGRAYQKMKETPATAAIFDDSLFQSEIISVPGLSADMLAG